MKNTKTKEPRYYEISVVRDTITRVVEVDDSISNEELEDYEDLIEDSDRGDLVEGTITGLVSSDIDLEVASVCKKVRTPYPQEAKYGQILTHCVTQRCPSSHYTLTVNSPPLPSRMS